MSLFHIGRQSGEPITYQGQTFTLQNLVVRLNFSLPNNGGGIIYNRPMAVSIQGADEQVRTIPILNYTRLGVFLILGLGLFMSILIAGRKHD